MYLVTEIFKIFARHIFCHTYSMYHKTRFIECVSPINRALRLIHVLCATLNIKLHVTYYMQQMSDQCQYQHNTSILLMYLGLPLDSRNKLISSKIRWTQVDLIISRHEVLQYPNRTPPQVEDLNHSYLNLSYRDADG